ncbi:hypothetical protein HDV00_011462 [Rhizophlyctis rosea]|nr:hypothetical protein HDV00_011462 [Rhizophlyctis rosea]
MSAPISFTNPRGTRPPQSSSPPTNNQTLNSHTIIRLQLFPHAEQPHRSHYHGFSFPPVEKDLRPGTIVRIGRKVDKRSDKDKDGDRHRSRRDKSNNVSEGAEEMDAGDVVGGGPAGAGGPGGRDAMNGERRRIEFIAFRSKVVSRTHAELWADSDGQIYFRDVGSSSGTFLNRLRLSPSGKESKPHPLKSGDVLQLGVDYQGRQEEIYKCVMIKVFVTRTQKPKTNPQRLRQTLTAFLTAMNPNASDADAAVTSDCCICLSSIAPFQALFLAPCSHCFHYKCATPLLSSAVMFQCPLCRQVANLEANVTNEEYEEEEVDGPPSAKGVTSPQSARPPSGINIAAILEEQREVDERVGRVTATDPDALLSDTEIDGGGFVGSPPADSVMTLARGARSKAKAIGRSGTAVGPISIPGRRERGGGIVVDSPADSPGPLSPTYPAPLPDDEANAGGEARTFVVPSTLKAALREQNAAIDAILNELPPEVSADRKREMRARLLKAAQEATAGIQRQGSPVGRVPSPPGGVLAVPGGKGKGRGEDGVEGVGEGEGEGDRTRIYGESAMEVDQ